MKETISIIICGALFVFCWVWGLITIIDGTAKKQIREAISVCEAPLPRTQSCVITAVVEE